MENLKEKVLEHCNLKGMDRILGNLLVEKKITNQSTSKNDLIGVGKKNIEARNIILKGEICSWQGIRSQLLKSEIEKKIFCFPTQRMQNTYLEVGIEFLLSPLS